MRCIQDTTEVFTALTCDGLASDTAVVGLSAAVGYRIQIAVGDRNHRCCGSDAVALVAVSPTDPSLPGRVRSLAGELAPGTAIAAASLRELVGGRVAMPGLDVKVVAEAELGEDGVVLIGFTDAAALLAAPGGERLRVETVAVLAGGLTDTDHVPPGWRVAADGLPVVPLRREHAREGSCAA